MANVEKLEFRFRAGYAVLLVTQRGGPLLVTRYDCRADFLAEFEASHTPADWSRLTKGHRIVREIETPVDAQDALDLVRCRTPEHLSACERLIFGWLRKRSLPQPSQKQTRRAVILQWKKTPSASPRAGALPSCGDGGRGRIGQNNFAGCSL